MYYQVCRYEALFKFPEAGHSASGDFSLSAGIRLALLSDLHNNIFPGLLEKLEKEAPDAVVIAGDLVNRPSKRSPARFGRAYGFVKKLAARYPVYYVLGNHEAAWRRMDAEAGIRNGFEAYKRGLERKGVRFLINEREVIAKDGLELTLVGMDLPKKYYSHRPGSIREPDTAELEALAGRKDPLRPTVIVPHSPRFPEAYRKYGADLVLAGHYHGGIVRLPFVGGLVGPGYRLFPGFTKGLYVKEDCRMIVSAGIGTHSVPFRIFNPREITVVDILAEEK